MEMGSTVDGGVESTKSQQANHVGYAVGVDARSRSSWNLGDASSSALSHNRTARADKCDTFSDVHA